MASVGIRKAHYLRPNQKTELPSAAVWLDTETTSRSDGPLVSTQHLNFGWACYSRTRGLDDWTEPEWFRFDSPTDLWDWIESLLRPKMRLYVFAHNWGFDGPVLDLFGELPRRGFRLSKPVADGPPVILSYRREKSTILCLDTLNWWRMPLSSIGASLGYAKLPMPDKAASRQEWDIYCRRDVEIIHKVMRSWWRFLRVQDLGSFAPTLASQAMRAFRHRFMDHQILIDDNVKALALSRESMHGGRVECFRLGRIKGPVTVLDVNSMYPFVMRDNVYPSKILFHTTRFSLSELKGWVKDRCVVARVRLNTKRNAFAHVVDNRLTFPIGRFVECLTTPDLIDAIEHNEIHSVIEAAVYEAEPLFNRFVSECYSLRQDAMKRGDTVSSWLLKILMNSLYGKFGQRGLVWEDVRQTEDLTVEQWIGLDYETGAEVRYRRFSGVVQALASNAESFESFPAIASHVTAYARRYLFRLMQYAGSEHVLYVDTDSLFLSDSPDKNLASRIDPSLLGGLKLEDVHEWIHLHGPKDYQTPKKTVTKGIKANAVLNPDGSFTQEQFSSLTGLIGGQSLDAPRITKITKRLARKYLKGRVSKDGSVLPFVLREW